MPLRIIPEPNITPEEDAAIKSLLCIAFPSDAAVFSKTRAWNGSAPAFSAILELPNPSGGGVIIAHLGVVDRTISVNRSPLRIAGIQNVAVHPNHRGRHLTAQTMALALDHARQLNFDAALLFCIPALEKLYARLGYHTLASPTVTRIHHHAEATLPENHLILIHPLRQPTFPPGPIHLNGDDW